MKFDYEKINDAIANLQSVKNNIQNHFDDIKSEENTIPSNWKGPASESYTSKLSSNITGNFDRILNSIQDNINYLTQVSNNYQAHEKNATNIFNNFGNNLHG